VRKGGTPGLGRDNGLQDWSMETCCNGSCSPNSHFSRASFRERGGPCAVLAAYSTEFRRETIYTLLFVLCINFYILKL